MGRHEGISRVPEAQETGRDVELRAMQDDTSRIKA